MNIAIKLARPSDIDILVPLVAAYHRFERIELGAEDRKHAITTLVGDPALGAIWLLSCQDSIVGYLALCYGYSIEFGGRDAFVDELFIEQAYRGRGFGAQALTLVAREAAAKNIRALHLEVAKGNKRAQGLYTKLGFEARAKYQLMSWQIC